SINLNGNRLTFNFTIPPMGVNVPGFASMKGAITGNGQVILGGFGILSFNGLAVNTYAGSTIVNSGYLGLGRSTPNAAIPGPLTIGDGANFATVVLGVNDQVADSSTVTVNYGGSFDLSGQSVGSPSGFHDVISGLVLNGGTVLTGSDASASYLSFVHNT